MAKRTAHAPTRTPSAARSAAARARLAGARRLPNGRLAPTGAPPAGSPAGAPGAPPPGGPPKKGLDILGHQVSMGTAVTVVVGVAGAYLAYQLYQNQAGGAGSASVPTTGSGGGGGGNPSSFPLSSTPPALIIGPTPKKVPTKGKVRTTVPRKTAHHRIPTHRTPTGGKGPTHRTHTPPPRHGRTGPGIPVHTRVTIGRIHSGLGGQVIPAHGRARTPATTTPRTLSALAHAHNPGLGTGPPHRTHAVAGAHFGKTPQIRSTAAGGPAPRRAGGMRTPARVLHAVQAHPVSTPALHRVAAARHAPPSPPRVPAQVRRASAGR